jgi:2-iminobutanoate/2-iminopropanoate deaminase
MSGNQRQKVESPEAPPAVGPYSQAVKAVAPGYLFVSGQLGLDPDSGELASSTAGGQAERCLKNILAIVKRAGGDRHSLVKLTIYLSNMEDFKTVNQVYAAFFRAPYPARSCLGGCDLPKGALVEIDAIAALEG